MNTDLYIYVNTNVCYKKNMFAYRVVETIKNFSIMKVGGKKSWDTMDSNRRHVTPRPPALPLSYRGKRVRPALSIVVISVRSVLNITSGCCVSLLTFGGGVAEARLGWRVNNNIRRTNLTF